MTSGPTDVEVLMAVGRNRMLSAFPPDPPLLGVPNVDSLRARPTLGCVRDPRWGSASIWGGRLKAGSLASTQKRARLVRYPHVNNYRGAEWLVIKYQWVGVVAGAIGGARRQRVFEDALCHEANNTGRSCRREEALASRYAMFCTWSAAKCPRGALLPRGLAGASP